MCLGRGRLRIEVSGANLPALCVLCDSVGSLSVTYDSLAWFKNTDDVRVLRVPPAAHLPYIHPKHLYQDDRAGGFVVVHGSLAQALWGSDVIHGIGNRNAPPWTAISAPLPHTADGMRAQPSNDEPLLVVDRALYKGPKTSMPFDINEDTSKAMRNTSSPYRNAYAGHQNQPPTSPHTRPSTNERGSDPVVEWLSESSRTTNTRVSSRGNESRVGGAEQSLGMLVIVAEVDGKVLAYRNLDGQLSLPTTIGLRVDQIVTEIAAITGLSVAPLKGDGTKVRFDEAGAVCGLRVEVVGATLPSVSPELQQDVEWVDPTTLQSSPHWPIYQPILTAFDLWEPPAEERVVAIIFGSWVHSPGHPTPPRSEAVDVAVGYFGKTPPAREVMQEVGEKKGREWAARHVLASVNFNIRVHHGMQKVVDGRKVESVEFQIPERITMTPGCIKLRDNPSARGGFASMTDKPDPKTSGRLYGRDFVTRAIPWAFQGRALSLSTLLFSATSTRELVMMWRSRAEPIIVRLDNDATDPLRYDHGFDLANLRNAIHHSSHAGVFEDAMPHLPWGNLLRMLSVKNPNDEHRRLFKDESTGAVGMILLDDGAARLESTWTFASGRKRTEAEIREYGGSAKTSGVWSKGDQQGHDRRADPVPHALPGDVQEGEEVGVASAAASFAATAGASSIDTSIVNEHLSPMPVPRI
jgi:hypothetical protein